MNWISTNTGRSFCRVNSRSYTNPNIKAHQHLRGMGYYFNILNGKAQRRLYILTPSPLSPPLLGESSTLKGGATIPPSPLAGKGKGEGECSHTYALLSNPLPLHTLIHLHCKKCYYSERDSAYGYLMSVNKCMGKY